MKSKMYNVWVIQLLLRWLKPTMVDHINGNGLDNRKENLRFCTNGQNIAWGKKRKGASKFKGVSWYTNRKIWVSKLKSNGVNYFLGYFEKENDAAKAYDIAAMKYHGEFARLNFP